MSHNQLGVTDLPIIGTKGAPKKFKGQSSNVETLIQHMERLYAKYNVTTDKDKVQCITQYCSRKVKQFMEGLTSYNTPNWAQFVKDLKKFYEADKDSRRHKVRTLEEYVISSRAHSGIPKLASWMKYNRGFISIAGWLEQKCKITSDEKAIYFWKGIPKSFRERLEFRLLSSSPNHDLNKPFPIADVTKAAETILKRDRFDNDRLPSDSEDSDSDDSDEGSDGSDEVSDNYVSTRRSKSKKSSASHKKEKSKPKKKVTFKIPRTLDDSDSSSSEEEKASKPASGHNTPTKDLKEKEQKESEKEFEELIKQLNSMSLKDPDYATVYFKAYRIDPVIKDLVPTPNEQRRSSTPPARNREHNFEREPPPHLAGPGNNGGPRTMTCFGCGKQGHSMSFCPGLRDLANKGIVKTDANGCWAYTNGAPIIRDYFNEPLVQAIQRATNTQSNLVTIEEMAEMYPVANEEEVYAVQHHRRDYAYEFFDEDQLDPEVYPVEATRSSARQARKEKFDGVHVPPRKDSGVRNPAKPTLPFPRQQRPPFQPVNPGLPKPVEVDTPTFNPNNDDEIMEDVPNKPSKGKQAGTRPENAPAAPSKDEAPKLNPRVSELQNHVDPSQILDKMLSAPVNLKVGEIMAVSKEMAQRMQEVLKPKSTKSAPEATSKWVYADEPTTDHGAATVAAFMPKTRGQLIKMTMFCEGVPIDTIIDTGSQLNICSKKVWQLCIKRPMDVTKQITMNDANGGEGTLSGFLGEVPLRCGDVLTYANIYIGEKAPFNLLLGRPWQRGNYITIDERLEGTFLVFKDKNLNSQWEMIVSSETIQDPTNVEFYQRNHHQPSSMFFGKGPTPKLELEYGPFKAFRKAAERALAGMHLGGNCDKEDSKKFEWIEEEPKKTEDTYKKTEDTYKKTEENKPRRSWLSRLREEIKMGQDSLVLKGLANVRANVELWVESYSPLERDRMRRHLMLALDFPEGLVQWEMEDRRSERSRAPSIAPTLDPLGLTLSERQLVRMEWSENTIEGNKKQGTWEEPKENVFLGEVEEETMEDVTYATMNSVPIKRTSTMHELTGQTDGSSKLTQKLRACFQKVTRRAGKKKRSKKQKQRRGELKGKEREVMEDIDEHEHDKEWEQNNQRELTDEEWIVQAKAYRQASLRVEIQQTAQEWRDKPGTWDAFNDFASSMERIFDEYHADLNEITGPVQVFAARIGDTEDDWELVNTVNHIGMELEGIETYAPLAQPNTPPGIDQRPKHAPQVRLRDWEERQLWHYAQNRLNEPQTHREWHEQADRYLQTLSRYEMDAVDRAWKPYASHHHGLLSWKFDVDAATSRANIREHVLDTEDRVLGLRMETVSEWKKVSTEEGDEEREMETHR